MSSVHRGLAFPTVGPARSIHYIYAADWAGTPFTAFYERAKARGWATREITCGHDVMLDRPEELTAALLQTASTALLRHLSH